MIGEPADNLKHLFQCNKIKIPKNIKVLNANQLDNIRKIFKVGKFKLEFY